MKTAKEHLIDFLNGVKDTFFTAPYAFGDFLARVSGFRDWQANKYTALNISSDYYHNEAINEVKIVYEAFKNNKSRDMLLDYIVKDLKDRPMYYIGGAIITQRVSKITLNSSSKEILYKSSIVLSKIDNAIHKIIEDNREFYDFINDTLNKSSISPNDILDIVNDDIEIFLVDLIQSNLSEILSVYLISLDNFSNSSSITLYDPLTLDLNNDGVISTTNLDNGVYFDHNGDHIAFKSTWINKDDGLLVYDKNGNGLIDSGAELFGNFSVKKSDELAKDGFEALCDLDSNNDAIVSNLDNEFVNLKVWQDLNQNGISEENELRSLDELGIKAINLNTHEVNKDLGNGNFLSIASTYLKGDNTAMAADINMSANSVDREFKEKIEVKVGALNLKGSGFVRDLGEAISLSDELANLANEYAELKSKSEQIAGLDNLIKAWAKSSANYNENISLEKLSADINTSGAGSNNIRMTPSEFEAFKNYVPNDETLGKFESVKQKLAVVNAFLGRIGTELFYTSKSDIDEIINTANLSYEKILDYAYKGLLTQTRLKEYVNLIELEVKSDESNYKFELDYGRALDKLRNVA